MSLIPKPPFRYELAGNNPVEENGVALRGHFRIVDANDDAICFCYVREHAEHLTDMLNQYPSGEETSPKPLSNSGMLHISRTVGEALSCPKEYSKREMAGYILNSCVDDHDYLLARQQVMDMGIDPDSVPHSIPKTWRLK